MNKKLVEMLHLDMEPVGIFFAETKTKCDLEAAPGKRNCIVPFLVASAKGKVACMDEAGCTCPGGAAGDNGTFRCFEAKQCVKRLSVNDDAICIMGEYGKRS